MSQKVVICGAGFLGSSPRLLPQAIPRSSPLTLGFNIAKTLLTAAPGGNLPRRLSCVQISSRSPDTVQEALKTVQDLDHTRLLPPHRVDVTDPTSLNTAFKDADVVVSLVGLLRGTPEQFKRTQWKGAENVAKTASGVGAKLIHFSAIGADVNSTIPYWKTKALGERAIFAHCPDATIFRPSIVFGPGDGFFTVSSVSVRDHGIAGLTTNARNLPAWQMSFPSCLCLVGELHGFSLCSWVTWPTQCKR